jgi:hypothetical protein
VTTEPTAGYSWQHRHWTPERPPPQYEYAQAGSLEAVNRKAADGWRCVTVALGHMNGVLYLLEREKP